MDEIPTVQEGFGFPQDRFVNGRTAVAVAAHGGITSVKYFGELLGAAALFSADKVSAWTQCFRCYAVIDGRPWHLRLSNTRFYPCGYVSDVNIGDVSLRYAFAVINDGFIHKMTVLRNPGNRAVGFRLRFHDACLRVARQGRSWAPFRWQDADGAFLGGASDQEPAQSGAGGAWNCIAVADSGVRPELKTWIGVASDSPDAVPATRLGERNFLNILDAAPREDVCSLFVLFGNDEDTFRARLADLRRNAAVECEAGFDAFGSWLDSSPRLGHADASFMSCFHNAIPCVRFLSIPDAPRGAMRASQDYGVWGWDSLVYADSFLIAGKPGMVADMLEFYKRTAHPEKGVFHACNMRMEPTLAMAFGVQGLYPVMLYHHHAFTADTAVLEEYYSFAAWIMERCGKDEVEGVGLTSGVSLWPDHPKLCGEEGEEGRDIAAINNSIYYQALRCMEQLAGKVGDHAKASLFRERAARCREGFIRHLYDAEVGYFVDSVSAVDMRKRPCYPRWAVLWVTPFAYELVSEHVAALSKFMRDQFVFDRGLRAVGLDDMSHDADGNQLAAYYPSLDPYYFSVMKFVGAGGELKRLARLMGMYWDEHTYPEGFTECAGDEWLALDNPGCKQAFSAKAWYLCAVNALAGIEFDSAGITVSTSYPGEDLTALENISYRGRRCDFVFEGAGPYVESLALNGRELKNSRVIGHGMLADLNVIQVRRSPTPPSGIVLTRALGAEIERVEAQRDGHLEIVLSSPSGLNLCFHSVKKPEVRVDGKKVSSYFSPADGNGHAWIDTCGKKVRVSVT